MLGSRSTKTIEIEDLKHLKLGAARANRSNESSVVKDIKYAVRDGSNEPYHKATDPYNNDLQFFDLRESQSEERRSRILG